MSVTIGSNVSVLFGTTHKNFVIVDSQPDPARGQITAQSPIARAIMGLSAGEKTEAELPNGARVGVEILQVS